MKRVRLLPYNMASVGCKNLSAYSGFPRLRKENSAYKYRDGDLIINWGCSNRPPHIPDDALVFNKFESVATAVDKLETFAVLEEAGISIPEWTSDKATVFNWIIEGDDVVVRYTVNGHGGEGIDLLLQEHFIGLTGDEIFDSIPRAPLYTKYVPKKKEYRVHVFKHQLVDLTRKALGPDMRPNDANWKIRNHDNGFIFVRFTDKVDAWGRRVEEKEMAPNCVILAASSAVEALGLDFGAVDVIYHKKRDKAYVLEVNTAPGIEGTTVENYTKIISRYLER